MPKIKISRTGLHLCLRHGYIAQGYHPERISSIHDVDAEFKKAIEDEMELIDRS
jgi:hypothetical protein